MNAKQTSCNFLTAPILTLDSLDENYFYLSSDFRWVITDLNHVFKGQYRPLTFKILGRYAKRPNPLLLENLYELMFLEIILTIKAYNRELFQQITCANYLPKIKHYITRVLKIQYHIDVNDEDINLNNPQERLNTVNLNCSNLDILVAKHPTGYSQSSEDEALFITRNYYYLYIITSYNLVTINGCTLRTKIMQSIDLSFLTSYCKYDLFLIDELKYIASLYAMLVINYNITIPFIFTLSEEESVRVNQEIVKTIN